MRGIYSFVLVFVFIACLVLLTHANGIVKQKLAEGSDTALAVERASFYRFQLEENVDSIIEGTIDTEITLGNREPISLNKKIAVGLDAYFRGMQGKEIEFFEVNTAHLSKQFTPTGRLDKLESVEEYCKTSVMAVEEHVYLVKFHFTGGLMRNRAVLGRIRAGKAEQYFLFLPGFTIDRLVVVAA